MTEQATPHHHVDTQSQTLTKAHRPIYLIDLNKTKPSKKFQWVHVARVELDLEFLLITPSLRTGVKPSHSHLDVQMSQAVPRPAQDGAFRRGRGRHQLPRGLCSSDGAASRRDGKLVRPQDRYTRTEVCSVTSLACCQGRLLLQYIRWTCTCLVFQTYIVCLFGICSTPPESRNPE